jgi:predicted dienelactone hydrolase
VGRVGDVGRAAVGAAGLWGCVAPAEPPPDVAPADVVGPYGVGATTIELVGDDGEARLVEVWYPAMPVEGAVPEGYGELSVGAAFRDAPLDPRGAPYDLVAFSHGYGGIRYQSSFLTERLASHGFVVVAPDHLHNTLFDLDEDLTAAVALARPGDVSRAVDAALDAAEVDGVLQGAVSREDVDGDGGFVMMGHSFGAWTSLVVGGGALDLPAAAAWCAETPTHGCAFFDLAGVTDVGAAVPDPRARGVVALAAGGFYTFGDDGLRGVVEPVLVAGRLDGDLPYDTELRPTYNALGDGVLVSLARTGHWSFTDLCPLMAFLDDCGGEEDGFTDWAVVQGWTSTIAVAAARRGRAAYPTDAAWLTASGWSHPDITVERRP